MSPTKSGGSDAHDLKKIRTSLSARQSKLGIKIFIQSSDATKIFVSRDLLQKSTFSLLVQTKLEKKNQSQSSNMINFYSTKFGAE